MKLESLGSENRSLSKYVYWLIVVGATLYIGTIFLQKYTPKVTQMIMNLVLPSVVSTTILIAFGILVIKVKSKRKYLVVGFIIAFGISIYFVRTLVASVSVTPMTPGLGLAIIYLMIGTIASFVIGINTISSQIKPPIDTVTVESEDVAVIKLSLKWKIVVALCFMAFTFFMTITQNQAFVQAPIFGLSDFLYGEALVSGIVGGILETALFFAVIQPVTHSIVFKTTGNVFFATVGGVIGATLIFFLFHTTVYQYNQEALMSVAVFGLFNSLIVLMLRDNVVTSTWHFTNNFCVVFFQILKFAILTVV